MDFNCLGKKKLKMFCEPRNTGFVSCNDVLIVAYYHALTYSLCSCVLAGSAI